MVIIEITYYYRVLVEAGDAACLKAASQHKGLTIPCRVCVSIALKTDKYLCSSTLSARSKILTEVIYMTERTNTTGTNATNNTSANLDCRDERGCIVLKIDIFKTKFAADAADTIDKMVAEKADAVESVSIDDNATEIAEKKPDFTDGFDDAVHFLKNVSAEDFIELVRYAKTHSNKFIGCVKELRGALNADDAYCSALIDLSRPLGEQVENRAFSLLDRAVEDEESLEGSLEDFVEFFEALKVINS
jgi:hypothetical protein